MYYCYCLCISIYVYINVSFDAQFARIFDLWCGSSISVLAVCQKPELQLSFSFRVCPATPTQAVACVAPQAHSGRSQLNPRWSGEQRHTNVSSDCRPFRIFSRVFCSHVSKILQECYIHHIWIFSIYVCLVWFPLSTISPQLMCSGMMKYIHDPHVGFTDSWIFCEICKSNSIQTLPSHNALILYMYIWYRIIIYNIRIYVLQTCMTLHVTCSISKLKSSWVFFWSACIDHPCCVLR